MLAPVLASDFKHWSRPTLILVRDENAPPGWPMPEKDQKPYGFAEHRIQYGNGENQLRTTRLAQPCTLKIDDTLATGERVVSQPRRGGNGAVLVHLTGGANGHWISIPARVPIALLMKEDGFIPNS